MSDTIKKLSEYLDINPEDEWSEVKARIDKKFVTIDSAAENDEVVEKVMGRSNGVIRSQITKIAGIVGLEGFGKKDISEMKTTDVMDSFAEKASEKLSGYETEKAELEKAVKEAQKNGSSAKDVQELQEKLDKVNRDLEDKDEALTQVRTEYDNHKKTVEEKDKESFFNRHKDKAFSSVKLKAENEYTIKGFKNEVFSDLTFEREGDDLVIRNKEGKKVTNPDKAGEPLTLDQIVAKRAAEAGLVETNPHADKKVTKLSQPNTVVPNNNKADEGRGVVRGTRRTA